MTFDQIKTEVMGRMSLSSADADVRVGDAINRHHKRITSLLGMESTNVVTSVFVDTTPNNRYATVTGLQKILDIHAVTGTIGTSSERRRLLLQISGHNMASLPAVGSGSPTRWAETNVHADGIGLAFDSAPATSVRLWIAGWKVAGDLSGSAMPEFPASFHDILTWFALAEELMRKEKLQMAAAYEAKAESLLSDLRFHLADTHTRTLQQNSWPQPPTPWPWGSSGDDEEIMADIDIPWTPFLIGNTGTYNFQIGVASRQGAAVVCTGRLSCQTAPVMGTSVFVGGFPYVMRQTSYRDNAIVQFGQLALPVTDLIISMAPGTSEGLLLYLPPGGGTQYLALDPSFLGVGTDLTFSVRYLVNP